MERRELIEAIDAELKRLEEVRRLLAGSGAVEKPKVAKSRVGAAKKRASSGGMVQRASKKRAWKKASKKIGDAGRYIGKFRGVRKSGGSGGTDDGGYGFTGE